MLNIIIIVLVLVGLTVYRYLNFFWEEQLLPAPMGLVFFTILFVVLYLINFIWMFGLLVGTIISLLAFFQIIYMMGLWIFLLPWLRSMHQAHSMPAVNPVAFSGFPLLVIILGVLTAANFFVSPYMSIWKYVGTNYKMPVLIFLVVLIVGNVARLLITSKLMKEHS